MNWILIGLNAALAAANFGIWIDNGSAASAGCFLFGTLICLALIVRGGKS